MVTERTRRIATYERVSSEDQRERETIKTQTEELARRLEADPTIDLARRYVDDGVSGIIPMSDRTGGRELLHDAGRGRFTELWIYNTDRLGRDDVDPLLVRRELERLGVKVRSLTEDIDDPFMFHIYVAVAAKARRDFLQRTAAGMNRAAREGRYCGGIVPLGYRVKGAKQHARLIPDDAPMWGNLTAAQVVARIFHLIAVDEYSARRVADEFNRLGVLTTYQRDGRGVRGMRTQGVWRPGRILQIVKNTTYCGEYRYGKRPSKPGREVISAPVPPIVSKELWDAAQDALRFRSRRPPGERRRYVLRSLIKCEICGLNYTGTMSHGDVWYRCNGALAGRGPLEGRCPGKGVKGDYVEPVVKEDIERFLRDPGDLLDELAAQLEAERESTDAVGEAERATLQAAMEQADARRNRLLDLYLNGRFHRDELDGRMNEIEGERAAIQQRLGELESAPVAEPEPFDADLLPELKRRLDAGLSHEQWHEIVSLLVRRIVIHTAQLDGGKKQAKAVIEYAFDSVVETVTGRGSSPLPS